MERNKDELIDALDWEEKASMEWRHYALRLKDDRDRLYDALTAIGDIEDGYCFCSTNRCPDRESHEPQCRAARAAIHLKVLHI